MPQHKHKMQEPSAPKPLKPKPTQIRGPDEVRRSLEAKTLRFATQRRGAFGGWKQGRAFAVSGFGAQGVRGIESFGIRVQGFWVWGLGFMA